MAADTPEPQRPVIVLGAGGHAAVLIDALQRCGRVVLGCLTADGEPGEAGPLGTGILGGDAVLSRYQPTAVELVNGVGATDAVSAPGGLVRHHLHRTWQRRGFVFATVIHPAATVAAGCEIAAGAQIMAGAVIQTGTRIGPGSIVNTGARIDHDGAVGGQVHIAPGATLCGAVTVGDGAFIGAGATLVPGIAVGDGARIGAGMTILADVPADARLAPADAACWRGLTGAETPIIRIVTTLP
jgi:UDP-perosamine 4-acetyltransferase